MIDQLILLGVSHQTAPVAVREQIARLAEDPRLSLQQLRAVPGVHEGMLLSTCNRVEIYGAGTPLEGIADGFRTLSAQEPAVVPHLYELRGERAVRHLFRVASSLDSMIVGEPQILGQLKQAYRIADRSGAAGDTLHRAMGRAFAVAKRVRTETDVGRSSVSMVHAAVELTARVFDGLAGKRALVIGAGEMARLAAERLLASKVAELRIANRTLANAQALARRLSASVPTTGLSLDALGECLAWADVVLASASVDRPLVTCELLRPHLKSRRFRTLLLVDISVPRCVEPEVASFENVYVKDVDDVGRLAAQNAGKRSEEARRAEEIVEAELESFARVLRGRSAVPVLNALRERGREVAQEEARRTLGRLGASLDGPQRESIEAMAQAIVNKLLHEPTAKLRAAAEAGEASLLAEAAGELFGLAAPEQPEPSPTDAAPDGKKA